MRVRISWDYVRSALNVKKICMAYAECVESFRRPMCWWKLFQQMPTHFVQLFSINLHKLSNFKNSKLSTLSSKIFYLNYYLNLAIQKRENIIVLSTFHAWTFNVQIHCSQLFLIESAYTLLHLLQFWRTINQSTIALFFFTDDGSVLLERKTTEKRLTFNMAKVWKTIIYNLLTGCIQSVMWGYSPAAIVVF